MKIAAYIWESYLRSTDRRDTDMLDIINIAFGVLRDGVLSFGRAGTAEEIRRLRGYKPELKILLSVGGWGAGGFSLMSRTEEGARRFAASCAEAVRKYGLDGIDLDWEYPTIADAGIDADPSDRENFTRLLRVLRDTLGTGKMLTIAAGAGENYLDAVSLPDITPLLDCLSLMTYDMAGVGCPAGHHTALRGSPSVEETVRRFRERGVPYEKMLAGAALYSRKWTNIPAGARFGLGKRCDDPNDKTSGLFGPSYGELARSYINKNGYLLCRDEAAGAPYLYHPEERVFLSFDDEESVAAKARWCAAMGLYGIMYWEHSCDPERRLLTAMYEETKEPGRAAE